MGHVPGLEAQADWAGDHGHFVDCDTGELVEVHVFVMTLPYSDYLYCEGSKLKTPVFLHDLLPYKVRQLDLEYIHHLGELNFVRDRKNLIIWGAPGTGKTWMGKAMATKACQKGIRTRWVTYPFLCRELLRLKAEDSHKLEVRIKYYSGYPPRRQRHRCRLFYGVEGTSSLPFTFYKKYPVPLFGYEEFFLSSYICKKL